MISARPATPDDVPQLARLRATARAELAEQRWGERYLADLDALAPVAPSVEVVVCIGRVAVGYGVLRAEGEVALLSELFVEPDARGVGAGHVLLEGLRDAAVRAGAAWLESVALPGDRATKNFFEAHAMVSRLLRVASPLR